MSDARLDKWLVHARLCKTRGLAQKLIVRGQVRLNGAVVAKSGAAIKAGDDVTVVLGPVKRSLTVKLVGLRRGPPAEARTLYDEPTPPQRLIGDERGLSAHRLRFS